MAADRRVAYQLSISAGASLKTLRDLTTEAHAAAAAIAALDEAQRKAAGSLGALGMGGARARPRPAPTAGGAAPSGAPATDPVAQATKEAAAQLRAEARMRAQADRELERQRQAAVRQELGAIDGKAELERERVVRLRAQLEEQGRLTEKETDLLERRLRFIEEDATRQRESLSKRGVDPRAAFGATGTRQTTIGSGVLSGFFDQLLGDTGNAGAKLDGLRDAAGRADTSLKTLAGALGVVSPGAQAAATAAGDLVGSLEVLLTPAGATVGAMAAVGVALGAAGFAAVEATLHIAEVADELAKLDALGAPTLIDPDQVDGIRDAAAAVNALSPAFSALVGVLASSVAPAVEDFATSAIAAVLLIRRGLESADLEGIFDRLGASIVKTVTLPIEGALRAVAVLAEARNNLQESVGAGRDPLIERIATGARDAIAELEGFQVRAGRALVDIGRDTVTGYAVGLRAATAEVRDEAQALVDAVGAAREDSGDAGGGPVRLSGGVETGVAEYGDAVEAAEDALQRLREIGQESRDDLLSPWEELANRFARARMELAGLATAAGPTGDALAGAAGRAIDAQEARARSALVASGVEAANREIAAQDAQARAAVEARAARPGEAVDRFGSAVGQLGQGNAVGAIGAATGIPQVQVVGAALDALAQLGQLSEEELEQRGEDFARAVAAGLEVLPSVLVEVLPELALSLAEAIGEALLSLPDAIGAAVYEAVTGQEVESRGAFREGLRVASAAGQEGSAEEGAIALAVAAIRGSRSRQAAARTLSSGVGLPGVGARTPERGGERALVVRGSGPGLARAIALEADAPYGRRWGVR